MNQMRNYENLLIHVVKQATLDYLNARRSMLKEPDNYQHKRKMNNCAEFFRGQWYTDIAITVGLQPDGDMILERLMDFEWSEASKAWMYEGEVVISRKKLKESDKAQEKVPDDDENEEEQFCEDFDFKGDNA